MKITELKPLEKNPFKSKGDEQIQKIAKSIQDFERMLTIRRIVIDEKNEILGGNKRYFALKKLGYKEIPDEWIERVEDLTEDEKREFIVKDNSHWGSEWDYDLLTEWQVDLEDWGVDLPDWGVEEETPEAVEDDFDVPEGGIETDIVLGDIFELSSNGLTHRLLCGDSTDSDSVAKLMNGEKADMVFTDPPYGMKLDTDYSGMSGNGRKGKKYDKVIGDNDDFKPELINTIFDCFNYCSEIFIWGVDYYFDLIPNFKEGSLIVWDKTLQTNGDAGYNSEFELCWSKTPHKKEVIHFNWFRYFGLSSQDIKKREHPTQKPLQVINPYIEKYSKHLIADLYLGSGSTMVAGHQLKRKVYGMELDCKYCQVIVDRMKKLDPDLVIKKNGKIME